MTGWVWLASSRFKACIIMISDSQLPNGASLLGSGDCCWWYATAGDMCYSYKSLCGHVQQPGSLDSCGHYARRTLMAPLPVAVQSGPFVWKWVYIHLLLDDSPSSPPWAYSSSTHTHTHTYRVCVRVQTCSYMSCNRGHLGDAIHPLCWRYFAGQLILLHVPAYQLILEMILMFVFFFTF